MPLPEVYTFCDAVDALIDASHSYRSAPQPILRRAVRAARDEIIAVHQWPFLLANGRILLRAVQTTGTVAYDHTGGTSERELTLTDATWPEAWVANAAVRFDDMVCDVQEYVDSTHLILDSVMNPGQDVASGESYTLYPRWYPLPADFGSIVQVAEESSWKLGHEISFREMMARDKYIGGTGDPAYYAIGPAQDQLGTMALYLDPASDTTEPIDFVYRRRLRDLRYSGHNAAEFAGTIAVTAGNPTVTGTGTSFESGMVNSILRISSSTNKPTGLEGTNAWAEQRVIKAVAGTDSLTLDANVSTSRTGRKYVVSDPVDVAPGVWHAFLACAAKHYAVAVNLKEKGELIAVYRDALTTAKQSANVSTAPRIAHIGPTYTGRLADSKDRSEVP